MLFAIRSWQTHTRERSYRPATREPKDLPINIKNKFQINRPLLIWTIPSSRIILLLIRNRLLWYLAFDLTDIFEFDIKNLYNLGLCEKQPVRYSLLISFWLLIATIVCVWLNSTAFLICNICNIYIEDPTKFWNIYQSLTLMIFWYVPQTRFVLCHLKCYFKISEIWLC